MGLDIRLLGPFRVLHDNQDITNEIRQIGKADVILKLLLNQPGQIVGIEDLIDALWNHHTDLKKAKGNLYKRISKLRKILEPSLKKFGQSRYILLKRPQGYYWNSKVECRIDFQEYLQHYERARKLQNQGQISPAIDAYETALRSAHDGEYLIEDRTEEWAIPVREKWQETHLDLLKQLANCYVHSGQYRRAIECYRHVLRLEKFRESTHRQLMLYYYLAGDQAEAPRTYEQCVKMLKEELATDPTPEIKQLYEQIRAGHVPEVDRPPPSSQAIEFPYALSPGSVPFVGRKHEYAQLMDALQRAH
ncbi:winged helix-turn-helix domain-containing protein [Candidatus Acetothermia bacterium]|nr:winged helix-turn-helix domain-containing protein [Candidatus Acetothermia bacterium]